MGYAAREETRHEHLAALREIYGYKMFSGQMRLLIQQLLPRAGGLISRVWARRRHN